MGMISVQEEDFAIQDVMSTVKSSSVGGIVTFVGVVRSTGTRGTVSSLEIEAYKDMALGKLHELAEKAKGEYEIEEVTIVHRVGKLNVGENIVCICVSAQHRKPAFKACEYIIDELKKLVPIWKKEHYEIE